VLMHTTAVELAINESETVSDKGATYAQYKVAVSGKTITEARDIAMDILGTPVDWDWDRAPVHFYLAAVYLTPGQSHALVRATITLPAAQRLPFLGRSNSVLTPTWSGLRRAALI
jgi:hypothetical protein